MATTSTTSSSTSMLKDEIKRLVKAEFEKSIKTVCSEEDLKKVPTLSEGYSDIPSKRTGDTRYLPCNSSITRSAIWMMFPSIMS